MSLDQNMQSDQMPPSSEKVPGAQHEVAPGVYEVDVEETPTAESVLTAAQTEQSQTEQQLANLGKAAKAAGIDQSAASESLRRAGDERDSRVQAILGSEADIDQLIQGIGHSEESKTVKPSNLETAPTIITTRPGSGEEEPPASENAGPEIETTEQMELTPLADALSESLMSKTMTMEQIAYIDNYLAGQLGEEYLKFDKSKITQLETLYLDLNKLIQGNAPPEELKSRVSTFKRAIRKTAFMGGTSPMEQQMGIMSVLPEKLLNNREFLTNLSQGTRLENLVALTQTLGSEKLKYLLDRMGDEVGADVSVLDSIKDKEVAESMVKAYQLIDRLPAGLKANEVLVAAIKGESRSFIASLSSQFGSDAVARVLTIFGTNIAENPAIANYILTPANFVDLQAKVGSMTLGAALQQRMELKKLLPQELQ